MDASLGDFLFMYSAGVEGSSLGRAFSWLPSVYCSPESPEVFSGHRVPRPFPQLLSLDLGGPG